MKKAILFLFLSSLTFTGFCTTWTVTNSGFAFSPATLTIKEGDTVIFDIADIHTVVEVTQSTWNNNGNTPIGGGFQLGSGGGTVLPADLTVGNHWYVCGPHASGGMKGMIIVETTTAVEEPIGIGSFYMNPNPTSGKFQVTWSNNSTSKEYKIDVLNISGQRIYQTNGRGDQALSQNVEVNLSGYPEGIYLVRIHDSLGTQTRKIILQ